MWICHRSNRRNLNVNAAANDDSFASDTNKEELLIWKRKMWNMPFVRGKYQNESGTLSYVLCNYYRLLKVSNQCDLLCFISLWASREALYRVYSGSAAHHVITLESTGTLTISRQHSTSISSPGLLKQFSNLIKLWQWNFVWNYQGKMADGAFTRFLKKFLNKSCHRQAFS